MSKLLITCDTSKNFIKNNVIVNHDTYGIVITAALDVNYWPAHGNIVKENLIMNSRRADIALSGVSNLGNCFDGNRYDISIPPGLQSLNGCDSTYVPLGSDMSVLWNTLARVLLANSGEYMQGDWKTFDYPSAQPNMPVMQKLLEKEYIIDGISSGFYRLSVKPAFNVFSRYKKNLKNIELPDGARKYLN